MTIIGIDPGPKKSAVVKYDPASAKIVAADYGKNVDMVHALESAGVDDHATTIAIEVPQSYGQVVGRSVLDTVYAIGYMVSEIHWGWPNVEVYGIARPTIKSHILGQSKGTDADVSKALRNMIDDVSMVHNVTDGGHKRVALAVAVAVAHGPVEEWKQAKPKPKLWRLAV